MATVLWDQVPPFYHKYIQQVAAPTLDAALEQHATELPGLLRTLSAEQWEYRYAPGKWTIKEVVQHIIDSERIFCYRALAFARGEQQSLPGFDENGYADHATVAHRSGADLLAEFEAVQQATRLLFRSFTPAQLQARGIANDNSVYVEGIGFIIAGHCSHHLQVLQERYLTGAAV